jgi:hypothetical protein
MNVEKELRNTGPDKENFNSKKGEEYGKLLQPEKSKQMDGLRKLRVADNWKSETPPFYLQDRGSTVFPNFR